MNVLVPTTCEVARTDGGPVDEPVERPRFARVAKNQFSRFTEVDDATCSLLGRTREELIGSRSLDLIHPENQQLALVRGDQPQPD